jgi:hypothetical protein
MAITAGIAFFGETSTEKPKGQSKYPPKGREKQGLGVVLAEFHRVWPLAGLTVALVATVGWMGLLGYVAIKLL